MTIRHIVFDIGQVLLHWDPELPYRRLIPDEARRTWFLSQVCSPEWNLEQDRGRSWAAGEAEAIARHPGEEEMIRAYRPHWAEMVPAMIPDTPDIMVGLIEAGHDVTLLTNFHHETFAEAVARFPVLACPRGATVSGAVGMVKPDAGIYAHHAEAFGLDPSATLFFDDSAANVAAAERAGWRAHQFTDAHTMRSDLEAAGIAAP